MSDAARALPEHVSALPPGTRLAEFEIRGLLGVGGFGIVYLAFDHALEREVAIKEYMPASMAGRTETLHVSLRSQGDAEVFALGLRSFVNEAKLLARFDHPSLIKVHRFWEANGTAYMAMPVLRGRTLRDIRKTTGRGPDEAWIRSTLTPLLGALEVLHNEGVYHRDIAPDNIHLEAEGRPVLLDFGAARRVISGKTQTLTAILKPAYAPIEQYAESNAVKQGPWTDIYALGATLHYMLLGYPPAPSTARTVADESSALTMQAVPGCSPQMLAAIEWMLGPRPSERPQSVAELRAALDGRLPIPQRASAAPPSAQWDKTVLAAPVVTIPLSDVEHTDIDLDGGVPAIAAPAGRGGVEPTRVAPIGAVAHGESLAVAGDDAHRLPPPPATRARVLPLAMAGLVLAGAVGYFGWSKWGPASAGAVAAPLAAASAGAAPGTGTPAAAAPVASSAAGVATVAAAAAPASAAVPAATAAAPAPEPAEAGVMAGAASGAAVVGAAAGAATPSNAVGASPAAQGAANGSATPARARAAVAGAPAVAPATTGNAEPAPGDTPELRCGGRNPLSQFVCMERECLRARFKNHPQCQAWRQQARPRDASGN